MNKETTTIPGQQQTMAQAPPTAQAAQEKQIPLEKQVKFSWGRVIKQGLRNMKDDIDPVYKGTKMGVYALHGIPTWVRECKDGRLANDAHGWAGFIGLAVGAASGLGYYIATKEAVAARGIEGYAVLGIPLAFQGASYVKEAFRRAKKGEHAYVIKARLQKAIEQSQPQATHDLTYNDMIKQYEEASKQYDTPSDTRAREQKERERARTGRTAATPEESRMEVYKELSKHTDRIFSHLFAYDQAGKKYELSQGLEPITKRYLQHKSWDRTMQPSETFAKMIWDSVAKNNGSADIEWLGKVTAIYGKYSPDSVHYEVVPTKMWKR